MDLEIRILLGALIARGNELRRRVNIGKLPDEQIWKAETIDWLRRVELLTRNRFPATSIRVIPDLNTDINLYRMLISHQLSDLGRIKEKRSPAVPS
jgi:hypothetical protein